MSKSMTIAICSYQRRDPLLRLLLSLVAQARREPSQWEGIDVVVVLDGSSDGSAEAARGIRAPFPLRVVALPHAGLSTARNECLARATGELIYFLDDDLVPADGTVARHRDAERDDHAQLLLGPCTIPADFPAADGAREWFAARYAELELSKVVDRFDLFSIANASAPAEVLRSVGGFDPDFVGYGFEDYELGLRLAEVNVHERFDPDATAWHYSTVDERLTVTRNRETGRNAVRLLHRHPSTVEQLASRAYSGPAPWMLDRLGLRRPGPLGVIASTAQWLGCRAGPPQRQPARLLLATAAAAAHSAGVADLDPSLVDLFLGRPRRPTVGVLWWRRSSPHDPVAHTEEL